MAHYYSGRGGEVLTEQLIHTDDDCPTLLGADGGVRPIADTSVPEDAERCPECAGGEAQEPDTISEAIDRGACPWCDEYEGDHVGQHASSAHPEQWDEYNE